MKDLIVGIHLSYTRDARMVPKERNVLPNANLLVDLCRSLSSSLHMNVADRSGLAYAVHSHTSEPQSWLDS